MFIYIVGHSITDNLSHSIKITKSITLVFDIILFIVIIYFVKKNNLKNYYGLNKPKEKVSKYLFYIPLVILSFFNLIFLIPCIITHSLIDVTSTFSNNVFAQPRIIMLSAFTGVLALSYGIYLSKGINNKIFIRGNV